MSGSHTEENVLAAPADEFSKLYGAGDEEGALDIATRTLSSGALFAPPFESVSWLCEALRRRRRFRLALALISQAQERGYHGWRALYLRGTLEALNRRLHDAMETLDRSLSQSPEDKRPEVATVLARVNVIAGNYENAQRLFAKYSKIRDLAPRTADVAVKAAFCAGNMDLALNWARQSTNVHGATAERARFLAMVHMDRGEWQEARKAAEEGLKADAGNIGLSRLKALAFFREGRIVQAINHLEGIAGAESDWTEGKIVLCKCLVSAGRRQEALVVFRSIERESGFEEEVALLRAQLRQGDDPSESDAGDVRTYREKNPFQDREVQHLLANVPDDFAPSWTRESIANSGNIPRAIGKLFHSVRTIMLRETMARFGRHEIGYLWAIIEPLIHVTVVSCIFYFIRMRDTLGMNVVLFVATGIIPLFFYMKTYSGLVNVLKQNRPLLNHPGVQPMDIFFARSILEFFTQLFVFIVFVVAIYLFIEEYKFGNVWSILTNLFGLWITGIGMGLLIGSLVVFAESIKNVMDGSNRIIYVASGVFFTLDMMPPAVAEYLEWNPLLHFVDGVRGNFNPLMGGTRVDIGYAYVCAVAILFCGLVADRALRHRVLDR
ncbi:MAG: ABC transporter permease [Parvibaculum sp.]|uniref:ABC transporter permease n=1 Tax=Parvibaculum sp. TaxID=2024848 RepID=UPI001B195BD4|nr:ABC transporter permease [Parvibaculum sp.]MBO6636243.1 ABC transporter permease [Parvibaculum sp.]MBO6685682.1 ABC transporter permease [Parvibaculum sp.]MBO6906526.1 ABC transporter permease [Parvibaculum sp.]